MPTRQAVESLDPMHVNFSQVSGANVWPLSFFTFVTLRLPNDSVNGMIVPRFVEQMFSDAFQQWCIISGRVAKKCGCDRSTNHALTGQHGLSSVMVIKFRKIIHTIVTNAKLPWLADMMPDLDMSAQNHLHNLKATTAQLQNISVACLVLVVGIYLVLVVACCGKVILKWRPGRTFLDYSADVGTRFPTRALG